MSPGKPAPEPSAEYAEAGMFAFRLDRSMHEDPYRKTIKLILDRDKDILAAKQAELDAVKAQNLALRDAVLGNGTFVCEIDPVQYAKETRECLAQARAALAEIKDSVNQYYQALSAREHGGVAQDKALARIQQTLGMDWESFKARNA